MLYCFKEKEMESSFSEYGFAVKNHFLSNDDIQKFTGLLMQYNDVIKDIKGFSTSTDVPNQEFRIVMRDKINEIISIEKINTTIEGYSNFYSNLLIKKPSLNSEMCLHTDWSITDENLFRPLQIWIPLVDVNTLNGTLGVIPASQQFTNKNRGLYIGEPYIDYINNTQKEKYLHYFNLQAGTAVFYHPGIIHYSPSNLSEVTRFAILVSLYPNIKKPLLYYNNKLLGFNNIEVYELTNNFFTNWNKKSKPAELKKIGKRKKEKNLLELKDVINFLNNHSYTENN